MPNDMKIKTLEGSFKTRLEPFGRDHDCLIVCHNEAHARIVAEAFQLPAMYLPGWNCALAGHRFSKIIVFQEFIGSMTIQEQKRYERWFYEFLPTKLDVNHQGNIHLV